MLNRRQFLFEVPAMAGVYLGQAGRIRQIDIIHHTHTDVGFTSAPSVVRDQQKRYIDAAIDLCMSEKGFRWTVESILNLGDWWQVASAHNIPACWLSSMPDEWMSWVCR